MKLLKHPAIVINNNSKPKEYNNEFDILSEAIPYIKLYEGQTMVISFDETMLDSHEIMQSFSQDVVLLKNAGINPVIVHGATINIKRFFEKHNVVFSEYEGMPEITTHNIDFAEMVSMHVNKRIVSYINNNDGLAVGISGKDGRLIEAKRKKHSASQKQDHIELMASKLSAELLAIHPDVIASLEESDVIPVISSIGFSEGYHTLYVDHDSVASMIASSLSASKLIYLTETDLFLENDEVIEEISSIHAKNYLLKDAAFSTKEKIRYGLQAVDAFTDSVHYLNSAVEHGLVFEILSDNRPGTVIYPSSV